MGQNIEAAKKEGKIVLAITPASECAKKWKRCCGKIGLEAELVPRPDRKTQAGSQRNRMPGCLFRRHHLWHGHRGGLTHDGMLEPWRSFWFVPEVKMPTVVGAAIYEDNVSTHNSSILPGRCRHSWVWYNPAWQAGRVAGFRRLSQSEMEAIGFTIRACRAPTIHLVIYVELKGEEFLKKLCSRSCSSPVTCRPLTDALAKVKLQSLWLGRSQTDPFVSAGLPLKPVPAPKEGLPASNSFGVIGIVKNPPHPNATKVFINWFLNREGQDWYGKIMENGSRRLDVDTKWLKEIGVTAAKDVLTLQDYHRLRNHLEDKYTKVRVPAGRFAETF